MRILKYCFFILLLPNLILAQDKTLQWESHFSYAQVVDLALVDNYLYVASENALFTYDLYTKELETISSVEGLDGGKISSIAYEDAKQLLLIGYESGLLQLQDLKTQQIYTFIDIVEKQTIQANKKTIHHIRFQGDYAYLSTDYGISIFNLSRLEFGDTYYIGYLGSHLEVRQTALYDGYLYAATPGGVKRALASSPNLIDPGQWFTREAGDYKAVQVIDNKLYAWKGNTEIQNLQNNSFVTIHNTKHNVLSMKASKTHLNITTATSAYAYSSNFNLEAELSNALYATDFTIGIAENDNFFQGTAETGVLYGSFSDAKLSKILPEGPLDNNVFSVDAYNHKTWIAYGDVSFSYNPYPLKEKGVSALYQGKWDNIPFDKLYGANDLVKLRINRKKPDEVFFTSFQKGLLQVVDNKPKKLYNETNSILKLGRNSLAYGIRLYGLEFDAKEGLWFVQSGVRKGLIHLSADAVFTEVDLDGVIPYDRELALTDLVLSKEGNVFFATAENGVVGYNPQTRKFNTIQPGNSGGLTSGFTHALAIDLEDKLWIGTGKGIRVYHNTSTFFTATSPMAKQIIVEDNGLAQELLFEVPINSIVVDGANNKWVATSTSGAFYISSSGQEILKHLTKSNSPLPSNDIQDIAVDPESGKVFLATDKGLLSFQGKATSVRDNLKGLYAFPNPIRPEYTGELTISGLMENTNVKITDLEGNLVFETTSRGGTIQWDTRMFGRHLVASGVYFIMANANDGSVTKVVKVMIIR